MSRKIGMEYAHSPEKRALDVVVASGGTVGSSWLWGVMYVHNLTKGQSLLFIQNRIGLEGKEFPLYKFDTLYPGSEKTSDHLACYHTNQEQRELNEKRATGAFARKLRIWGLNEIPQFINVLKGDMSVVSPRALPNDYLTEAAKIFPREVTEWKRVVLKVKPGVLGVDCRRRGYPVEKFPERLKIDSWYVDCATLKYDLTEIAKVIRGRHVIKNCLENRSKITNELDLVVADDNLGKSK